MGAMVRQENEQSVRVVEPLMTGLDPATVKQTTVIVGMGMTGLSCARFLAARGESLVIMDNRTAPPMETEVRRLLPPAAVLTGAYDEDLLCHCRQIIISPGVSQHTAQIAAARKAGVPVFGDIELFARHARAPVIAITGSNGKSTVTALVTAMAQAAGRDVRTGANIGTPALDLLGGPEPDFYILELSSFQLETTTSLDAAAATLLNVSPDHMDRYTSEADYLAAKLRVYQGSGVIVVNRDAQMPGRHVTRGRRVTGFTLARPADGDFGLLEHDGRDWLAHGEHVLMPVADIALTGRHNIANALAALALGDAVGLPEQAMCRALRDFKGLPHRMQRVAEHHGVRYYNDSKGTNVGATLAALQGLDGKVVLIAGGLSKDGDFTPWRGPLADRGRAVVLIGRDAALIAAQLRGAVPVEYANDMAAAVQTASRLAQPGETVLLSPGCASFDMFSGYEQRGEAFIRAVTELGS